MNLKAVITVHFEADDAVTRAAEQARITDKVRDLATVYPDLALRFSEHRPRQKPRAPAPTATYRPSERRV